MNLSANIWYVKWFFWSVAVIQATRGKPYNIDNRINQFLQKGTNLCQFMRTILIGTFFTGANILVWINAVFVVFIYPCILFPPSDILSAIFLLLCILLAIAIVVGLAIGFVRVGTHVSEKVYDWANKRSDTNPGFFTLMIKYIVSVKQKFCPAIKFGDSK